MSDSESDNDFKSLIDTSSNEDDASDISEAKKPRKTKSKKKSDIDIEDNDGGVNLDEENPKEALKKKRDSPKYSGWLFTFNTNKAFPDKTSPELEELAQKLLSSVKTVFTAGNIKKFITSVNAEKIIRIKLDKGVELGEKDFKLHAHAWVSISHKTKCRLLAQEIFAEVQKKYLKLTGERLPYTNYKLYRKKFRDLDEIMNDYLKKGKKMW